MTCGVYVIEWANLAATREGRGKRSDVILEGSALAGCMVVSSRVLVIHLGSSPLMNTCLSSSLIAI
jgi:hypothetical protein